MNNGEGLIKEAEELTITMREARDVAEELAKAIYQFEALAWILLAVCVIGGLIMYFQMRSIMKKIRSLIDEIRKEA